MCDEIVMQIDIEAVAHRLAGMVMSAAQEQNYQGNIMTLVPAWWEKHKSELSPCEQRYALEICIQAEQLIINYLNNKAKMEAQPPAERTPGKRWRETSPEYDQWLRAVGWEGR